MYDPPLNRIITEAVSRLHTELEQVAPYMAQHISQWMRQLSGTAQPEDYFKHPLAFPALLLPWWLEKTLCQNPDVALQSDLAYSTINGYYYIRLIDNLMDGHATVELNLLPALGFFHTQFQAAYQPYFTHSHPFWNFFSTVWFHSGEIAMRDANLTDIDEAQFELVVAQKVCAAKIPLAAVCYRYEQPQLIEPWSQFVDLFGCWHQFLNDLFDWHKDYTNQTRTYFLSEAERRRQTHEPVVGWVIRAGFEWALKKLQLWMSALKILAADLRSPDLVAYLDTREAMLLKQQEEVAEGLQNLAKLISLGS
jgi:hypothetical protein